MRLRIEVPAAAVLSSLALVGALGLAACSGATPDTGGASDEATATAATDPKDGATGTASDGSPCGGTATKKCDPGGQCVKASDCADGVCKSGACALPAPDDGVKNGDETDVDCGGSKAPKCAAGATCAAHADCASDACSYEKKCVEYKGCTAHAGGDTCGAGETGDPSARHESCCATVKVPDRPAGQGGPFEIDKYQVTAGRMRAMVERLGGDLQSWAKTAPGWDPSWTPQLPASMSDALYLLGPGGKRGCNVKSQGGRTYWQDAVDGDPEEISDFPKDVLDEKALNCVTWYMAEAVCAWDGGRLATRSEIEWVFENRGRKAGPTMYPWQWKDDASYDPSGADIRLVHNYSYQTPATSSLRMVGTGTDAYPLDHAFWIAPPGRRPEGADMYGVEDAAGNMLMWVDDKPRNFVSTMSWENHPKNLTLTQRSTTDGPDGYYALGARCARN